MRSRDSSRPDPETLDLKAAREDNKRTRAQAEMILREAEPYRHYLERAMIRRSDGLVTEREYREETSQT